MLETNRLLDAQLGASYDTLSNKRIDGASNSVATNWFFGSQASIAVRSSTTTGASALGNTRTLNVPAGAQVGDIAVFSLEMDRSTGTSPVVTWPANFIEKVNVDSGNVKLRVAWKRLTAADTGTYVASWASSTAQWNVGHCALISGAIGSGDPFEDVATGGSLSNPVPAVSVNTTQSDLFLYFIVSPQQTTVVGLPAGYAVIQDAPYHHMYSNGLVAPGLTTISGVTLNGVSDARVVALAAMKSAAPLTGTVTASITGTDTASISISETQQSNVNSSRTDTADISISETQSSQLTLSRADTSSISVADASSSTVAITGTDTSSVSISEVSNVVTKTLVATNMVPNPSFEVDTFGWVQSSIGVMTRDVTQSQFGVASGKQVSDGTTTDQGVDGIPAPAALPLTTYTGSVYLKGNVGGETVKVALWKSPANASFALQTVTLTTSWQRFTVTGTTPSDTTNVYLSVYEHNKAQTWFMDGAMVELGSAASGYFDGDTPDTVAYDYVWTGTPHASASQKFSTDALVPITGTDTASLTIVESTGSFTTVAGSDTAALTIAESRLANVSLARIDTASLSISEAKTLNVILSGIDTAALTIQENAVLAVALNRADNASLSVTEVRLLRSPAPTVRAYVNGVWHIGVVKVYVNGVWKVAKVKVWDVNVWS